MRLVPLVLSGILFGALLALIEGFAVLRMSNLGFARPTAELFGLELRYGLVLGGVALLLALLLRRRSRQTVAALTFAFGITILLGWWVHKEILDASRLWEPISMAATVAVLLVAGLAALGTAWVARRHARVGVSLLASVVVVGPCLARSTVRAGPASGAASTPTGPRPDVTLIIIDTLRADRLSCYGNPRLTSPVLDDLAARGALFEECVAQSSWTRPSMASLHSGLYPSSHGCNELRKGLPESAWTLAESLQANGYATGAFSANCGISPTFGFDQGFDAFWNTDLQELARFTMFGRLRHFFMKRVLVVNPDDALGDADTVTDQAIRWLGSGRSDPTFLYVHYLDPHWPYGPPEYLIDGTKPPVYEYVQRLSAQSRFPFGKLPEMPAEAVDSALHYYDAEIRFCDRAIGRLLDHLRRIGNLDPEDLVIVSSDHGEQFYEHASWGHGTSMFREELRVPLILFGGGVPAGTVIPQPVRLFDVHPTILELAGIPIPDDLPAASLKPLLDGEETEAVRPVFSERISGSWQGRLVPGMNRPYNWETITSLQIGRRKLIEMQDAEREGEPFYMQFDLAENPGERLGVPIPDPGETLDRSDPAFTSDPELLRRMKLLQQEARGRVLVPAPDHLPGAFEEELRALGYGR